MHTHRILYRSTILTILVLALVPLLAGCAAQQDREYALAEVAGARQRVAATCGARSAGERSACENSYAQLESARIGAELRNREARRQAIGQAFVEGWEEAERNRPRQTRCTTFGWNTRCTTY